MSRINKKNVQEELPHELFLRTRKATKIRNAFAKNMLTDTKLLQFRYLKLFNQVDLLVLG